MSDDSRQCRRLDRRPITQRAGMVELDVGTRQRVAELMRAIDDTVMSTDDFDQALAALVVRLALLPRPERLEVTGQLLAHMHHEQYLGWRE